MCIRDSAYPFGMQGYLWANQVPMTKFGAHVNEVSAQVKEAALRCVQEAGRSVRYLQSSKDDKEEIARGIARKENIDEGPVCALTCVEPCWGLPDSNPPVPFEQKKGLVTIAAGATVAASVRITPSLMGE